MKTPFLALVLALTFALSPTIPTLSQPLATPTPSASAEVSPTPSAEPVDVVLDEIGFFTADQEREITEGFSRITADYGILPVVEVVEGLNGEDPQRFAISRANELGIGDAGEDNGLYILISQRERELRVEPGLGISRLVSKSTIQGIIDSTILPAFKQGNYVRGVLNGADSIGRETLPGNQGSSSGSSGGSSAYAEEFGKLTGQVLAWTGGVIAFILGGFGLFKYLAHRRAKAEEERRLKVAEEVERAEDQVDNDKELRGYLLEASTGSARSQRLKQLLSYAPLQGDEADEYAEQLLKRFLKDTVSYGKIPREFYTVKLLSDESVEEFMERIKAEEPEAKARQEAARLEEERLAAVKKRASKNWARLSRGEQETYALAKDRDEVGETLLDDYSDPEYRGWYDRFGGVLFQELQRDAQRAFDRIPRSQRESIARVSGRRREEMMESYMPGYNPLLLGLYVASATSFANDLRAEEARAAEAQRAQEAASSSSTSFSSFDSSSSFGGGSFDGGGGGGSW